MSQKSTGTLYDYEDDDNKIGGGEYDDYGDSDEMMTTTTTMTMTVTMMVMVVAVVVLVVMITMTMIQC